MVGLIRKLQNKRNKLNKRLGVVKSYQAIRSIQTELNRIDEFLTILGAE